MQVLSKGAAKSSPTHMFPPTDVKRAPSCLPKDIVGKAKSFLNQKFPSREPCKRGKKLPVNVDLKQDIRPRLFFSVLMYISAGYLDG